MDSQSTTHTQPQADRVSFSMKAGNLDALRDAINELQLSSGDVTRVGNIYYVRGIKPGAPINNMKTGE